MIDLKPRDPVTSTVRELHWLPIGQRIEYSLCLLVHKSLIGHAPHYISDLLSVHRSQTCHHARRCALTAQRPPLSATVGAVIRRPCVLCRFMESATDKTETRALVDNNIQASPEDILVQLDTSH